MLNACSISVFAQNSIGMPEIISYGKQRYGAGTQNWDIKQDEKGILYFANNEGVLSFDGTYWRVYPLPNRTIVRSIETANNRIYAGGQDELGYFSPDKNGQLVYSSLKNLIPEGSRSFADVWDISTYNKDIFFRTRDHIFQYTNNRIIVHQAPSEWVFMGRNDEYMLAQDAREGLMYFRNGSWLTYTSSFPPHILVTASITFNKDSTLLSTTRNGLWMLTQTAVTPFILKGSEARIDNFSGISKIDSELFVLSTTSTGCYIIDRAGNTIQHFAKGSGLSNSNVISVFSDHSHNLWLGLDNGIDFIAFDNAVKHINPASLNNGAGYGSAIVKNKLYLALSNGVFVADINNQDDVTNTATVFKEVANTAGQAWGLSVVNNHLLLGSHEGFFEITDNTAKRIQNETGYWTFSSLGGTSDNAKVVAGNYNGINIFNYRNGAFIKQSVVPGFNESSRFLVVDKNNIVWTSHPYRGVYKIDASGDRIATTLFGGNNGLPSSMNNHVYKIKNRIVIATEKGVYEYNPSKNVFQPSAYFTSIFGNTSIRYLAEDKNGNIWFIHEKDIGVVDFSTLDPTIIYLPELKGKMVSGFEHINPINENNILIGAQEGFYHINYEKYRKRNVPVQVDIRNIVAHGNRDSILFGGYYSSLYRTPHIGYDFNSFHIEYSSPLFDQQSSIEYSFYLKGFDKEWSEWSKKTEKDYTNLPEGKYDFMVKARNNLGNESKSSSYTFTIMPPWYRSVWAYAVYIILAGMAIRYNYKRSQKKFARQKEEYLEKQKQLQYLHQLELEKSEKEIVKLKNEKLQSQIEHKNSELASTAMHLVQKGEILSKIKDELVKLNKNPGNKEVTTNIKKIVKTINEDDKVNEDWEHFAGHFNNVHSDFLIALKEKYPVLSAHDLKLCAYLRMNLTSKEIAQLMNISLRGVEIGRYRLRKKLGIGTEVNLFDFMLQIPGSDEGKT
jgi:ligand-binding sensor domain-containing protein/DNA-binding CsgD family transcriptional regulator